MKNPKSTTLSALFRCIRKAAFLEKNKTKELSLFRESKVSYDPSRRTFLKNSMTTIAGAGLSAAFLGSCNTFSTKKITSDKGPRIAIIGGGIAGLHCAYVLQKAGIYSTVYEGSNRLGGRIFTQSNVFGNDLITEFGGEFLDTEHTDMFNLAKELGVETYDTYDDYKNEDIQKDTFYINDQFYSEAEVVDEFRNIVDKLESDKQGLGENYDTPLCEKLDQTSIEEYVRGLNCNPWLQDLIIFAYTAECGLDAGEQSALNFIDYISTETSDGFKIFGESDERYKLKGGNKMITEGLAEKLKEQIKTGHKIINVRNQANGYRLVFENGTEVNADVVVLAIPFTILRDIELNIKELSPEKSACINQLGYGQNNKLLLGFSGRPWRENGNSQAGYLFNEKIQNGWDNGHMQNGSQGPTGYTVYLGGSPSLELAKAAKEIGKIDRVTDAMAQRYLLKLDEIFPGTKAKFTGTHKAALWSNNPFVKASYACYKTGQWTSIAGYESEPVGNVYFAGEHCSEGFQGFMNGAAETGRQVAEKLIAKVKRKR